MLNSRQLWSAAIATQFGLDIPTTVVGIERYGGSEINPLMDLSMQQFGTVPGLVVLHSLVMSLAVGIWIVTRQRDELHPWMLPVGLALAGLVAGVHNLGRILAHTGVPT